ncbi:MAG: outer membrane beta-barrel protein, partial [Chitinophagales bacterium]
GYEFTNLYPLPGFIFGVSREMRLGNKLFFRAGGMLSYHVTSAEINAQGAVVGALVTEYKNIKARFRNTYGQIPLDLGISFGNKNQLSIYAGLKGSILLFNGSKWEYSETNYNYDFTVWPPLYLYATNAHEEETKLDIHKTDIAVELGFIQDLSDNFVLEERIYKGLSHMADFMEGVAGNNLEQLTFEVALAVKISQKK